MINPLVSVIIPNYNHAPYLDQRIQSVLGQTYQNFEVIILDDCSTDDSREVIERYRTNSHVTHIAYNEHNSGSTFKQWKKGMELAKGEIIWIAESDDYCEETFLDKIMECWNKYSECSIVFTASCRVDQDGIVKFPNEHFTREISLNDGIKFIKEHMVCSNFAIPNASAVTFLKANAKVVSEDYMGYKAAGDRLFWIYQCEKGKVCKIDMPLNFFRQHYNKVSPRKECDGTQAKENYRINKYLHQRGYVSGITRCYEYVFYWKYLKQFKFENEQIRTELISLWFPEWWRGQFTFSIARISIKCYSFIIRNARKLKHRIFK